MPAKTKEVARRRFTVHEYHQMAEAGILHEDDRIELLEGELVEKAAIGSSHFACVNALNRLLMRSVGDEYVVSVQNPVRLDERNEPEPDLAVLLARDYRESLPGPGDVLFLIEVADTTLSYDRDVKLPLYARSGVPEVWIVDLEGELVERHTGPSGGIYRHLERARRDETLASAALPELALDVNSVLG